MIEFTQRRLSRNGKESKFDEIRKNITKFIPVCTETEEVIAISNQNRYILKHTKTADNSSH